MPEASLEAGSIDAKSIVLQTASSDEISCRNRFFPSQKWELSLQMIFWIGRK